MNDIQLRYADYCIDKLHKSYDKSDSIDYKFETLDYYDTKKVIGILETQNWIVREGTQYKLEKAALLVLDKHKTYSAYFKFDTAIENRKEQKEIFDFKVSKWKYHTFWWFFGLAIFGGGYSLYDVIIKITTPKHAERLQNPKAEMESVESKSHTLTLDQKSLDSLHNSKTRVDSLKTK